MAKEIMILDQQMSERRTDGRHINIIFLHVMDPQILIPVVGTVIVPTPAVNLPQLVIDSQVLSVPELTALDDGSSVFEYRTLYLTEPESNNQQAAIAKVRAMYENSTFVSDLRDRYALAGIRINA